MEESGGAKGDMQSNVHDVEQPTRDHAGNYQHCFTNTSLPSTMSHLFDIRKQVLHPSFLTSFY